jgi:predicted DNA-binding protein YlxM (UPF0122 family)
MRQIRETLRLHLQAGLSYGEVARELKISKSAAGKYVSLEDTIRGFEMILSGELDHVNENDFYMKGSIDEVLEEFRKKRTFRGKIVTEISPLKIFYPAEEYHQDYFIKHPDKPYCQINIRPKIGKFEKGFKDNSKVQKSKQEKSQKPKE